HDALPIWGDDREQHAIRLLADNFFEHAHLRGDVVLWRAGVFGGDAEFRRRVLHAPVAVFPVVDARYKRHHVVQLIALRARRFTGWQGHPGCGKGCESAGFQKFTTIHDTNSLLLMRTVFIGRLRARALATATTLHLRP